MISDAASCLTQGFSEGKVTNLQALSRGMADVVERSERLAKDRARFAILGINGASVVSVKHQAELKLSQGGVRQVDIEASKNKPQKLFKMIICCLCM